MMFLRNNIKPIILITLLFISGCKKEELPPDVIGPTVFGVVGEIGGKAINIEAGVNAYYMYSSYDYIPNDTLYVFKGQLKKTNCDSNNCVEVLTISIRDNETRLQGQGVSILDLIKPGTLSIRRNDGVVTITPDSIDLKVVANPLGIGPFNYTWWYNGASNAGADSITYPVSLNDTGASVCLTIEDLGTNTSFQQCNLIRINQTTKTIDCTTDFNINVLSSDSVLFQPLSSGNNHTWDWGDGSPTQTSAGGAAVSHVYNDTNLHYKVTLRSDNGAGCFQEMTKAFSFKVSKDTPSANFTFIPQPRPDVVIVDSLDLSTVTITWVDASGTTYTSHSNNQPSTSTFEITEVELYANNEKGERTVKFTALVNCRLYNGAAFIEIKNAIVKFAVAYPT